MRLFPENKANPKHDANLQPQKRCLYQIDLPICGNSGGSTAR
ncbi:hypothetical protein EC9_26280 [Rosistilla ulvae]|uniref:Uncharacterized protein n=1 Tax=Rosistilla ulvae TaxID=1930277 RepID=A0A517M0P0_9BACT|nr:hypothetical protein EC9_26280 [Rosistilla ulvae]